MASDRERQEMDEAKIAEMEANARYILKREPATRALMLIGRAIGAHVRGQPPWYS